jgi:hypothetical protein
MTTTIHVEVGSSREGAELGEFLAGRGLTCSVLNEPDHCELDVGLGVAPEELLRRELDIALRAWLGRHEPPLVPSRTRDGAIVLRPPGD